VRVPGELCLVSAGQQLQDLCIDSGQSVGHLGCLSGHCVLSGFV
jgi:hypothetical protein